MIRNIALSFAGALVIATLIGPIDYAFVSIVNAYQLRISGVVELAIVLLLAGAVGAVIGWLYDDKRAVRIPILVSVIATFCVFGYFRERGFHDSDLGSVLPTGLDILLVSPTVLVGLFFGSNARAERRTNGTA